MEVINVYSPIELKKDRKELKLTQSKVAKIMGLSPNSKRLISMFERGNRNALPSIDTWRRWNGYLNATNEKRKTFISDNKGEQK